MITTTSRSSIRVEHFGRTGTWPSVNATGKVPVLRTHNVAQACFFENSNRAYASVVRTWVNATSVPSRTIFEPTTIR